LIVKREMFADPLRIGRIVMEGEGKELLLDEHIKRAFLAI